LRQRAVRLVEEIGLVVGLAEVELSHRGVARIGGGSLLEVLYGAAGVAAVEGMHAKVEQR
jgi:hypothetical protein